MYSVNVSWFFTMSVSTFGNLRIEAYLQLPAAYRSLSRPSSAPDAKAFTLCSYSLELPSEFSSAVLFELLEFHWTLFGFLFAVKRFDPFYKFSFRPDKTFVLFLGNCSSLPKFFGKTYSNLLFIKMCPLLSVRFYSFYFFIRFSMNIFFSVRFLALFYAKLLIGPRHCRVVGSSGLEPPTSRLSGARSNHLSYEPIKLLSMYLVSLAFCFSAFRG